MNEDFVTYETAQALKRAGFDWPCKHYYTKENAKDKNMWLIFTLCDVGDFNRENKIRRNLGICSAPTLAQAQKWLRKRGLCVSVFPSPFSEDIDGEYAYKVYQFMDYGEWNDPCAEYAKDYESALSAGIEAALKLIEEGEGTS